MSKALRELAKKVAEEVAYEAAREIARKVAGCVATRVANAVVRDVISKRTKAINKDGCRGLSEVARRIVEEADGSDELMSQVTKHLRPSEQRGA